MALGAGMVARGFGRVAEAFAPLLDAETTP
jgi:hypothetical protein